MKYKISHNYLEIVGIYKSISNVVLRESVKFTSHVGCDIVRQIIKTSLKPRQYQYLI